MLVIGCAFATQSLAIVVDCKFCGCHGSLRKLAPRSLCYRSTQPDLVYVIWRPASSHTTVM
jgi:hypothetical protein